MTTPRVRRPALLATWTFLFALGCGTARQAEPAGSVAPRAASPVARRAPAQPPTAAGLYGPEEALQDALSGPLEYVGTGPWHGIHRIHACVFRNQRVLVVNAYCTITEIQAFRVDVYSPQRGRVRLYAESKGGVSAHARREYFTFMAESEPPPSSAGLPAPTLTMSFQDLRSYEERRYDAFPAVCYGGTEHERPRGGCLGALGPRAREWSAQNRGFLEYASEDWHRLVRELRAAVRPPPGGLAFGKSN